RRGDRSRSPASLAGSGWASPPGRCGRQRGTWVLPSGSGRSGPHEAERDAEQGERLSQGEAEDEPGAVVASRLGLAGGGLNGGGEDDADTDRGTDGGKTVPDSGEAAIDT